MESIDSVNFGSAFHGIGWHDPEGSEASPYRWMMSGGKASITLITDRLRAVKVVCEIVSVISEEVIEHLDIFADGNHVEFEFNNNTQNTVLEFILPRANDKLVAEVTFNVAKVFQPNAADQRHLSLAFNKISVVPISSDSVYKSIEFDMDKI